MMKSSLEPSFDARRVNTAIVIVGVLFFALIARLYVLQVIRGDEYLVKSESNFVQDRRVVHPRGLVYDQAGRLLVDNRSAHDVYLTAAFLPDSTKSLLALFAPLGYVKADIEQIDRAVLAGVEPDDLLIARDGVSAVQCDEMAARVETDDIRGVELDRSPAGDCRVLIRAREFPSRAAVFRRLRDLVGMPADEMKARIDAALAKSGGLARFKPKLLLEDIGYLAYARIESAAALGDLPGIDVVDSQKRRYRNLSRAAHVLGYMNEISPEELKKRQADQAAEDSYLLGDLIGRKGIESAFENVLRGRDGVRRVVVDSKGRTKGEKWAESLLGDERLTPPVPGHSLVLAIDDELQATAEESFGGVAGSVVAMEVDTGFILAMASFPAYDPNLVTGPWSKEIKREYDLDKNRPWTNKATQEHYAPGSTFKAITAAGGLRNQLITESSSRPCPGFFRLGRSVWRCFNRSGHGTIALVKALQYSCDSYFYSLGYELGPDRLAQTGRLFSFGSRTGLDIGGESPGIMPDRAYYERRFGAYTPGLVVNNSIGQGDVTVTPLQLAVAYAAIANGGKVLKPQVVREVRDAKGNLLEEKQAVVTAEIGLDQHNLDLMKEALAHVTDAGGTASGLLWRRDRYAAMSEWLRNSGITIVGKTGTAQVVRLSKSVAHVDAKDVPYEQRDHSWFVGFAPYNHPEIVVVTMTEHGGFGGSVSGPVTGEVLKTWFTRVRGKGRYAGLPPIEPTKRIVPAPKKDETTEESARHSHEPEEDDKAIVEGGIEP